MPPTTVRSSFLLFFMAALYVHLHTVCEITPNRCGCGVHTRLRWGKQASLGTSFSTRGNYHPANTMVPGSLEPLRIGLLVVSFVARIYTLYLVQASTTSRVFCHEFW